MKEHIINKIDLMLKRYEKLGLTDSFLYKQLQNDIKNDAWLVQLADTLTKVKNADKILDVVGQMTKDGSDQRLMAMFAEIDTAMRLTEWAKGFFGTFNDAEYLERKNKRQPDFKAWNGDQVMPVETKTIGRAEIIDVDKFMAKVLKKITTDALPQLASFYEDTTFEQGIIFIWTQQRLNFEVGGRRVDGYWELRQQVEAIENSEVSFDTQIIIMFANPYDLWDYRLLRGASQSAARSSAEESS
jgi:hypothetical protein